ncbi:response regulator [Sphingomonas parva]|uniref:Response regulator n=2 Tax=Sphingomonas parva TaxID=2555898 RepID=A0A4Y8ZUU3_9SPHN|nr:response regulator [Sphingomonas parva]
MNNSMDVSHLAGRRIMIVDDVEDNRVVLDRQLRRAGFETVLCADGMTAVAEVSSNPPDLVILDWMMPGLSGVETLKAMREHLDLHRLPIIMCTARDEESSIGDALEAGANEYVQKPIKMPVLLARVSAQLMRQAAMAALGSVNQDLEALLAQRTRELFASRGKPKD